MLQCLTIYALYLKVSPWLIIKFRFSLLKMRFKCLGEDLFLRHSWCRFVMPSTNSSCKWAFLWSVVTLWIIERHLQWRIYNSAAVQRARARGNHRRRCPWQWWSGRQSRGLQKLMFTVPGRAFAALEVRIAGLQMQIWLYPYTVKKYNRQARWHPNTLCVFPSPLSATAESIYGVGGTTKINVDRR